jgi:hypothetical protein
VNAVDLRMSEVKSVPVAAVRWTFEPGIRESE